MPVYSDIVIIGAGPAGMSAAIAASNYGLSVTVLDRQSTVGGQIYRNVEQSSPELQGFLGKHYTHGLSIAEKFHASSAKLVTNATVWNIENGTVNASCDGTAMSFSSKHIIIASGAVERPVAVSGWTLPNVMGAGAADLLLKDSGLTLDAPVVIYGNGPLLLQSVTHLQQLDIPIAGILLTASYQNFFSSLPCIPQALMRPTYLFEGMQMVLKTLSGKAPVFLNVRNLSLSRGDKQLMASFSHGSKSHSLSGQTVLLHEGVIPDTRLTRLTGCLHNWNSLQRYWYPRTTCWGETTQQDVYAVGDGAAVYGAEAAALQGTLAGLECARSLKSMTKKERDKKASAAFRKLRKVTSTKPLIDTCFAPIPSKLIPADDAIVCRCEEITAGEIRRTIAQGFITPDGIKSQLRTGMGQCQGRMCEQAILEIIAQECALEPDCIPAYHIQPPIFPVSLGEIARTDASSYYINRKD